MTDLGLNWWLRSPSYFNKGANVNGGGLEWWPLAGLDLAQQWRAGNKNAEATSHTGPMRLIVGVTGTARIGPD